MKDYLTKMKIDHSAVLTTCCFGTSKMFFSSANSLVSDNNAPKKVVHRLHISPRLHLQQSTKHVILMGRPGPSLHME